MADGDGSGTPWWRRWGWWWAVLGVLLAVLIGLVLLWVKAPTFYDAEEMDAGDQATATATTRSGILVLGAAIVAAIGATVALVETRRANLAMHEREREAQVTDRYTKAIDQLGSDKLNVRLGGIYALERIARDSARDMPTVVEVLCAFARHGPGPDERLGPIWELRAPTDVQAAVTVIIRVRCNSDPPASVDLFGAHLENTDLIGAELATATLANARLTGANLSIAKLAGAALYVADLSSASLASADLTNAKMSDANLANSILGGANLTNANLTDANLDNADLTDANLCGASLRGAWLSGVNLRGANLSGANLTGAAGLSQVQVDAAYGTENTLLPDGLTRRAHCPRHGRRRTARQQTVTETRVEPCANATQHGCRLRTQPDHRSDLLARAHGKVQTRLMEWWQTLIITIAPAIMTGSFLVFQQRRAEERAARDLERERQFQLGLGVQKRLHEVSDAWRDERKAAHAEAISAIDEYRRELWSRVEANVVFSSDDVPVKRVELSPNIDALRERAKNALSVVRLVASDRSVQPLLRAADSINSLRVLALFGGPASKYREAVDSLDANMNEYVREARRELESDQSPVANREVTVQPPEASDR